MPRFRPRLEPGDYSPLHLFQLFFSTKIMTRLSKKSGPSNVNMFICDDNNAMVEVTKRHAGATNNDTLYGTINHKRGNGRRRRVFSPLSKQPMPCKVISLHRACVKNKRSAEYQRRISWTEDQKQPLSNISIIKMFICGDNNATMELT